MLLIGGGHNALVCANYLARAKKKVLVLEKRNVVGGAAVTEGIFPGYKFSRFSYVFSIFREAIIREIFPENWMEELVLYPTEPSLFIPTKEDGRFLLMSNDTNKTLDNIAHFCGEKDAQNYAQFLRFLKEVASIH